jgi:hypothetical protein
MALSIFLAKIFGVYLIMEALVIFGKQRLLIELINKFAKSEGMMLGVGSLEFLLGLILVLSHNVWDGSWRVIITVVSWLVLLEGASYLLLPGSLMASLIKYFNKKSFYLAGGVITLVFGLYLAKLGFGL